MFEQSKIKQGLNKLLMMMNRWKKEKFCFDRQKLWGGQVDELVQNRYCKVEIIGNPPNSGVNL